MNERLRVKYEFIKMSGSNGLAAAPSRLLYLDPAGEYVNDAWASHLQGDGTMTATEAQWQNGRSESHGKIVKKCSFELRVM